MVPLAHLGQVENLKTTIIVALTLCTAFVVLGTAEAAQPCNGIHDRNCVCQWGAWYCNQGDECGEMYLNICVEGQSLS